MSDVCHCGEPYEAHTNGCCEKTHCDEFHVDVERSPALTEGDIDFLQSILDRDFAPIAEQDRADALIEKLRHRLFS